MATSRPRHTRPRHRCQERSRPATWLTMCTVRPSRPLEWAAWRPWRRSDFSLPTRWKASQLNRRRFLRTKESHPQIRNAGFGRPPPYLPPLAGEDREGPNRGNSSGRLRSMMDWDKLKVLQAAAEAGSFTHAGELLGLSQSAVSRQVSALEQELTVALFHRHARGLILTEQGDLLYRTAHEVFMKLEAARTKLTDSREKPNGELRVNTTQGIGVHWLTPRLGEFCDLYPDIRINLITGDEELDLAMREADVAIRLRQPVQPDLIQRKLFSMHFHAYASPEYLKRSGTPRSPQDLDHHRIMVLGGNAPNYLQDVHWLTKLGRDGKEPRVPWFVINNVLGLLRACQRGLGIAMLPDYLVEEDGGLVQLFGDVDGVAFEAYFVYPEELKSVARIQVFRDFLVAKAQRWNF